MKKIGIVGSDNSHAYHFAEIINNKNEYEGKTYFSDYIVSHIFGVEEEVTRDRAEKAGIANIVESVEGMLGEVDAVIVVFRHGDLHLGYALPFVKAGIPVFIDKPFTIKAEDTIELINTAKENNTLITGGSTLKYLDEVIEIRSLLKSKEDIDTDGKYLSTGMVSYQIYDKEEYGGIHFYGPHTVETALFLFGYDVRKVYASKTNKNIIAILKYDVFQIVLNFMYSCGGLRINIIGEDLFINKEIDDSDDYKKGMIGFARTLEKGQSDLTSEQILMPVVVLNAIDKSLNTGIEVDISELMAGLEEKVDK
jgi:Predicted dehydrogenases and related proteins